MKGLALEYLLGLPQVTLFQWIDWTPPAATQMPIMAPVIDRLDDTGNSQNVPRPNHIAAQTAPSKISIGNTHQLIEERFYKVMWEIQQGFQTQKAGWEDRECIYMLLSVQWRGPTSTVLQEEVCLATACNNASFHQLHYLGLAYLTELTE